MRSKAEQASGIYEHFVKYTRQLPPLPAAGPYKAWPGSNRSALQVEGPGPFSHLKHPWVRHKQIRKAANQGRDTLGFCLVSFAARYSARGCFRLAAVTWDDAAEGLFHIHRVSLDIHGVHTRMGPVVSVVSIH